jgi:hypothetical protein
MLRILNTFLAVAVGFLLYPLLFVPLMVIFWPEALDWWIKTYAEYLRLWGI